VTGVSKAEETEPPVGYCEDCDPAVWIPRGNQPDPGGYCHRAAQQHARDTGHTTVVAVAQLTRYKPEGATNA
jgi:hypothetical protein